MFGRDGFTQHLTVFANFGDFEPGWNLNEPIARIRIPKQEKDEDEQLSTAQSAVMAAGASA